MNPNGPLGLPKGSVRALLAVSLVGASVYGFVAGQIAGDQFLQLVTMAAAFYFLDKRNGNGSG